MTANRTDGGDPPTWPFPTGKKPPAPKLRSVSWAAYTAQATMAERIMGEMLAQMITAGFVEVCPGVYERRDGDGNLLETVSF